MNKRTTREIDLLDLLKYIMYKWRVILVWMAVLLVAASLYQVYQNIQSNKASKAHNAEVEAQIEAYNQSVADANKKNNEADESLTDVLLLTKIQEDNVKTALNMYGVLNEYYSELGDTYGEADFESAEEYVLQYYLEVASDDANSAEIANTVANALYNYSVKGGLINDVIKAGYGETEDKDPITLEYGKGDTEKTVSPHTTLLPLTITCKGSKCRNLAKHVKSALEEKISTYEELGDISLNLIDEYSGKEDVSEKQNITENISSLYAEFISFTSDFNATQRTLFNNEAGATVLSINSQEGATATSINSQADKIAELTIEPLVSTTSNILKSAIIGLFLGIFLPACWYAMIYVFDERIKNKAEFESIFGYFCIGNLEEEKEHKGIDKFLDKIYRVRLESMEDRLKMTDANIKAICEKQGIKELALNATCILDEGEKAKVDDVISRLKAEDINASFTGNAIASVPGFETMLKAGAVIMVEKPLSSKYMDLDKMNGICREHNVKVIGAISL